MTTPTEHFSKITLSVIQELERLKIIRMYLDEEGTVPMDSDSPQAKTLIENITKSIYEGAVKDMNPHRAPDLS